mmetsp:Transcript_2276/g.5771  ORF Transcript_2276/g.5771 Transcript_2276/m.5771 type:complete len:218 (+) Transcript_2276:601-1254(+)
MELQTRTTSCQMTQTQTNMAPHALLTQLPLQTIVSAAWEWHLMQTSHSRNSTIRILSQLAWTTTSCTCTPILGEFHPVISAILQASMTDLSLHVLSTAAHRAIRAINAKEIIHQVGGMLMVRIVRRMRVKIGAIPTGRRAQVGGVTGVSLQTIRTWATLLMRLAVNVEEVTIALAMIGCLVVSRKRAFALYQHIVAQTHLRVRVFTIQRATTIGISL